MSFVLDRSSDVQLNKTAIPSSKKSSLLEAHKLLV